MFLFSKLKYNWPAEHLDVWKRNHFKQTTVETT